jgi:2-aminoadipate transaminase
MRLNFSAVDEGDIREGVRRIGKVVEEQLALYGSLTGKPAAPEPSREAAPENVVRMPVRKPGKGRAQGS